MNVMNIWPEAPVLRDGSLIVSAAIEVPGQDRKVLWYKIPESHRSCLSAASDHFALGTVFLMMKTGADVRIHGQVSPSLLRNLNEFQAAWVSMYSGLSNVDIIADHEQEDELPTHTDRAIMAFSGGVDSCFTAFRNVRHEGNRHPHNLKTGVMVHGFDIPLAENVVFASASLRSMKILESLGLEMIQVATNFRDIVGDWSYSHGTAVVSCLSLFRKGYSKGLVAQTFTYKEIRSITEGVNALTDPLLSSDNFRIIPDGAAFKRAEKILAMGNWKEFLSGLRVCWEGQQKDRNCCACEKCMRNILTFRALGLGLPACFDHDILDQQIMTLRMGDSPRACLRYGGLLKIAESRGMTGSWLKVLRKRVEGFRPSECPREVTAYLWLRRKAGSLLRRLKQRKP